MLCNASESAVISEANFSILEQNSYDPASIPTSNVRLKKEVERRQNLIGPMSVLFYKQPLELVRGKDVWLYDYEGKAYLDAYNNVQSIGHSNAQVGKAIASQWQELNCHNRYLSQGLHDYAERLLATLPTNIDRIMMTCTGSESNDLAIRCAREVTQKHGIIVSALAYHGNTDLVSKVSPSAMRHNQKEPWLKPIDMVAICASDDPAQAFLQAMEQAIDALEKEGYGCAAFLADTIFSSDGVYSEPLGFMCAGIAHLHAKKGLYIADEVQPGFGRTGTMWGFESQNITPDIVTMGKPMGNGYPVAAIATNAEYLAQLNKGQGYFNTFASSHGAVAAATAVLDFIESERLIENVNVVGAYFDQLLQSKVAPYPMVGEIRSKGFFYGIDIVGPHKEVQPELTVKIVNTLKDNHVLVGTTSAYGASLKLRPQLIFTKENADFLVDKLCLSLESVL